MRKITLASLLLLLAGVIAAHAQSELVGKNWYIQNGGITDRGVHPYMSAATGTTLTLVKAASMTEVFAVQEGSIEGTVKLYNRAAGKYVGHVLEDEYAAVPLVDEAEAAEYTVMRQGNGWALIDEHNENVTARNALCGVGNGMYVARYNPTDESSVWLFTETSNDVDNLVTNLSQIEAGKYYQISSSANEVSKKYISSEDIYANTEGFLTTDDDNRVVRRTNGSSIVPTLWQIEVQGDGKYLLRNANAGCCLGQIQNYSALPILGTGMDEESAGKYTLAFDNNFNAWSIKHGDNWLSAQEGTDDTTIGDYAGNTADNVRNYWNIMPVTEVPVMVRATTQWATLMLPFAVQLPEGLSAYYASKAEGTMLSLTVIDSKQIPANTPMFVAPDEEITGDKTYTLTILYDTELPEVEGNLLEGSTLARDGFAIGEVYVLSNNGTNAVLKYNGTDEALMPNKAYIRVSKFTNTAAAPMQVSLQIVPGQSTGISSIQNDGPQTEEYYDLTGRRVLSPAHGVFVTKSGRKILLP